MFSQATTQVRLQLSLFDSECKQFLGRTWIGPEISYKEGGKLTYNQVYVVVLFNLMLKNSCLVTVYAYLSYYYYFY